MPVFLGVRTFIFIVCLVANMFLWYVYLGVQEAVVGGALLVGAMLLMLLAGKSLK